MLLINEYESLSIGQVEKLAEKSANYVFWKDKKYRYLGGNDTAQDFMYVNSTKDIIGLTDEEFS